MKVPNLDSKIKEKYHFLPKHLIKNKRSYSISIQKFVVLFSELPHVLPVNESNKTRKFKVPVIEC